MISLISPAKTLDTESLLPKLPSTSPVFGEEANYLNSKLRKLSARQLGKLMDISSDLAELNLKRNLDWSYPFDPDQTRQAVFLFKGDVYLGLDVESLSTEDLHFAQNHLRILSGLYGILRPFDSILPYRLEMGTALQVTPKKKNLYTYWGSAVTQALKAEMDDEVILNLASNEYFKVIKTKELKARIITPQFLDAKNGDYKMISFFAKKARGLMARFQIVNRINQPDELKSFDLDGYAYNEQRSSGDDWVFTRG